MPGVNKKPTSKSFNAVTPHRRSARRLCTSAPRPTGSCYGTKPTRGTLDLHHSKYNDTKLTRKSVTYVVELKCYPCEWRAGDFLAPPRCPFTKKIHIFFNFGLAFRQNMCIITPATSRCTNLMVGVAQW